MDFTGMDTGLNTLVALARFHQIPADPDQLAHEFGRAGSPFTDSEILLAAKSISLKAKKIKPEISQISNAILPVMAKHRDGSYFILARVTERNKGSDCDEKSHVLIQDLRKKAPETLAVEAFEEIWAGEIIPQDVRDQLQPVITSSWQG